MNLVKQKNGHFMDSNRLTKRKTWVRLVIERYDQVTHTKTSIPTQYA